MLLFLCSTSYFLTVVVLQLIACALISDADLAARMDLDGDGVTRPKDCDDTDPTVGAQYADVDGDGYGGPTVEEICKGTTGFVLDSSDCDDADAEASPAGEEICKDGIDQDCDGSDCDIFGQIALESADLRLHGTAYYWPTVYALSSVSETPSGAPAIVIGAPYDDIDAVGTVYTGVPDALGDVDLVEAFVAIKGENAGDHFGYSVCGLGDADGDGAGDLIVGAPGFGGDDEAGDGAAYLVYGPVTKGSPPIRRFAAVGTLGSFGLQVGCGGDLTADGLGDFLVALSAPSETLLYSGAGADAPAASVTPEADDEVASAFATIGDTDGDGLDDLLVGVRDHDWNSGQAGAVYLLRGPLTGSVSLSDADVHLHGRRQSQAGWSVCAAGDLDTDGLFDFAVGAPGQSRVYLVESNRPAVASLEDLPDRLVGSGGWLGGAISGDGDIDQDGNPDLLLGAPEFDDTYTNQGRAYVAYGPFQGAMDVEESGAQLVGSVEDDHAGNALVLLPDVNGDAFDDIAVASEAWSEPGTAVYLLHGGDRRPE